MTTHTSPTTHDSGLIPSREIRVLHCSGRSDHGGGPEHILQAIEGSSNDVAHFVACPSAGVYWQRFSAAVGDQRLCPIPHRRISPLALWRMLRFVRRNRIDLIHAHGMSGGVYGRLIGALTGRPVVFSFHGVPVTPGIKHRVFASCEHLLARVTASGVAVSDGEADLIRARWPVYAERLVVVPNGIDFTKQPEWSQWPLPAGPLRIVSFSRRNHQKNPDLLIAIAQHLKASRIDARIDAYGEGLTCPRLSAAVGEAGLTGRVFFHPPVDDSATVMRGAHMYLSTSRWEGMPLAVIEAWRSGLLVVASDVVGNRDLISNFRTGLLYPDSDAAAAARAVTLMLQHPSEAQRIRNRARRKAEARNARELMSMRLAWLYRSVIAEKQQAALASSQRADPWPEGDSYETASSARLPVVRYPQSTAMALAGEQRR